MAKQNHIPVLSRSIRLLETIAGGAQNHSVAELGRELKIPPTTCYRILQTLIAADWLEPRSSGVGYEISYGLMPLAQPFLQHRVLIDTARTAIEKLVLQTGLSAKLTVRQADDAVTIFRAESPSPMTLSGRVGVRFHLAFGSSGSCLLAGLPDPQIEDILDRAPRQTWTRQTRADVWNRIRQAREADICVDPGQFHPSIQTITATLRDAAGCPVAALTLLTFVGQEEKARLATHRKALLQTAKRCRQLIGRNENKPGKRSPAP
ncbi:MAG: IclR family transcriptional regulator [Phycisphaeraceae bacterium]